MSYKLKIKAKHLAEEAKIIKHEERKTKLYARKLRELQKPVTILEKKLQDLHYHRIWDVRREVRATNLARAYISGKNYSQVESNNHYHVWNTTGVSNKVYYQPDIQLLNRVRNMVSKYSEKTDIKVIIDWLQT